MKEFEVNTIGSPEESLLHKLFLSGLPRDSFFWISFNFARVFETSFAPRHFSWKIFRERYSHQRSPVSTFNFTYPFPGDAVGSRIVDRPGDRSFEGAQPRVSFRYRWRPIGRFPFERKGEISEQVTFASVFSGRIPAGVGPTGAFRHSDFAQLLLSPEQSGRERLTKKNRKKKKNLTRS